MLEVVKMVSVNTLISITTVVFGLASLLLISKARSRLSRGSIREYVDNFSICLAFILIFSLWQTGRKISISELAGYPELIFIAFAYTGFILVSYRLFKISKEFGFKEEGRGIERIIKGRKKR